MCYAIDQFECAEVATMHVKQPVSALHSNNNDQNAFQLMSSQVHAGQVCTWSYLMYWCMIRDVHVVI